MTTQTRTIATSVADLDVGDDMEAVATVFRDAMSKVASPVTVVTTMCNNSPYGTTISAFASLSMKPAMTMFALDRSSELLHVIRSTGRVGINVLGAGQSNIAMRFAGKGGASKFDGVEYSTDHGLPRLPKSPGWLACEVTELVDGGDHIVVLATVVAAESLIDRPLVYHGRAFGTHSLLEAV